MGIHQYLEELYISENNFVIWEYFPTFASLFFFTFDALSLSTHLFPLCIIQIYLPSKLPVESISCNWPKITSLFWKHLQVLNPHRLWQGLSSWLESPIWKSPCFCLAEFLIFTPGLRVVTSIVVFVPRSKMNSRKTFITHPR